MIFACIAISVMVRFMVKMMLAVLLDIMALNHIVMPLWGWKLDAIEFLMTITITIPIIGFITSFPA